MTVCHVSLSHTVSDHTESGHTASEQTASDFFQAKRSGLSISLSSSPGSFFFIPIFYQIKALIKLNTPQRLMTNKKSNSLLPHFSE